MAFAVLPTRSVVRKSSSRHPSRECPSIPNGRAALKAFLELIEKRADGDFVRQLLALAADRLMDAEVETLTEVMYGERSAALP